MTKKGFTHLSQQGSAHMVAIGHKSETLRSATARASVRMSPETLALIRQDQLKKGDVLGAARFAAFSAAKQTSSLIPLCHPVRMTAIDVNFELQDELPGVCIHVQVQAFDRTGPEMEAMTAAATAALTIYDMCKAVDKEITIKEVSLWQKSGGKSGDWKRTP